MKKFWLNEQLYTTPSGWHECSQEQIVNGLMLQLSFGIETSPLKRAHWRIGMLRQMSNAPAELLEQLIGTQLQRLLRLTDWAFTARIDRLPFKSFDFEGSTYYLPAERLANTSAIELAMSNIYYLQFADPKAPNQHAALSLVATLCRPERSDLRAFRLSKDWNGDIREEYNSIVADERAERFKALPFGIVIAVLQYFESLNTQFLRQYGEVFGSDEDDDDEPLYKHGEGWIACLEDVAESGVHGPFKEVCSENVHTIFLYLKHRTAKNKRMEEEQRQQAREDE